MLVVTIHGTLVLVASRWVTRVRMHGEEPLVFLALPNPVQALPQTAAPSTRQRKPPPASRDTQLVTIPPTSQPQSSTSQNPPAPIDWHAEAELAVKQQAQLVMAPPPRALDKHAAGADFNGGLGPDGKPKPEFAWDRSHTHRVEGIEGGGIAIHINDHCTLLVFPLPFVACAIGEIPVRGDLFEHMHDAPAGDGK